MLSPATKTSTDEKTHRSRGNAVSYEEDDDDSDPYADTIRGKTGLEIMTSVCPSDLKCSHL